MKKQIEFDFFKWGQEGISVEIEGVKVLGLHQNPTNTYDYYGIDSKGLTFIRNKIELRMYQEIKPREIWVNEQEGGVFHYSKVFSSKAEAESQKLPFVIRSVKFREVLDDEQ